MEKIINANCGLPPETQLKIDAFRATHGRNPRVLHIGNIANNAYNNAKILNSVGVESDVICYDYYHIMGCPEWEDADFDATGLDHFKPDWTSVDLSGFKRPLWFAQGPQQLCIEYLIAKQTDNSRRATTLWQQLGNANRTLKFTGKNIFWSRLSCWSSQQKARARRFVIAFQSRKDVLAVVWNKLGALATSFGTLGFLGVAIVAPIVISGAAIVRIVVRRWPRMLAKETMNDFSFDKEAAKRVQQFCEFFPERADRLTGDDMAAYAGCIDGWRQLFSLYDIVQAYSTDGIYPLLANVPYIAFEHGTIRDIPYNETAQGRLTLLTYRCANHVFVTNFDCKQSADFLAPARYTLINHPYDEDHGKSVDGWKELRLELKSELQSDFLFFFPTRQDWVAGTGYADKANDVFLKAAGRLRAEGYAVGLVCCSWGANVYDSQVLLKNLGCERHVRWTEPMAIVRFERMAKACGCVVDQFKLGAFGGVLFKAMSIGVPVLTYLDEQRLKEQYEEVPPVINCRTEIEVAENMRKLIDRPELLLSKGRESLAWIKRFHGKNETIAAQINQYSSLTPT